MELDSLIRGMNPWWASLPSKPVPVYKRWAFSRVLKAVTNGPAPITVVRGPRQVGKSTIQNQVIESLLNERGVPASRILRIQFDDLAEFRALKTPIHQIVHWFENRIAGATLNQAARDKSPVFLLLDEVQNLPEWAPELKSMVDHHAVRVLVTGSSALRIEAGRDSLAGRIATIELGPLRIREVAGIALATTIPDFLPENGIEPWTRKDTWHDLAAFGRRNHAARDEAFIRWAQRGGYPLVHERSDLPWAEVADQLVETVVRRAINHDLRLGERGRSRDAALLEEVFRLACRYTGQSPQVCKFADDIRSVRGGNVGAQRISAYLRFLESAMLVSLVPALEIRLKRTRGPAKLCLCDHGLRAAWLQELVPLDAKSLAGSTLNDVAGRIVEGAVGQYLSGVPALDLAYLPERGSEPEVDYILTIGERRIPLEVKYRRSIDPLADTRGLRAFLEKAANNAPFGVLVTLTDDVRIDDPRIIPISLPSFLLLK